MSYWNTSELATLGSLTDGDWILKENYTANGVRLIQVGDVGNGQFIGKSNRFISLQRAKELQCNFLKAGDILISRLPDPLGRACIFPGLDCPAITAVDVTIFRPDPSKANPRFLNHFLNSKPWFDEVLRYATGTTRQRISRKRLEQMEVPIPPLAEQERIVKLLDEADELRKLRAQADRRTTNLIPALFHEMFGDPAINPKHWPIVTLGEIGGGGQYGLNSPAMTEGYGVRFIRITDIDEFGHLGRYASAFVPNNTPNLDQYELMDGDILIARSGATAGKAYIHKPLNERSVFAGYLIRFKINREKALPIYIFSFLKSDAYWAQLNSLKRSVAQPNVNAKQLASLQFPLPPLILQKVFAQRVVEIRELEAEQSTSQQRLDSLFQSLLHHAFEGEI